MLAIESEQDTFGEHWELFLKKKKKKSKFLALLFMTLIW